MAFSKRPGFVTSNPTSSKRPGFPTESISPSNVLESYTATEIADDTSEVNTQFKEKGRMVWDETNNRVMVASDSGSTDTWYVSDGSASVTPS